MSVKNRIILSFVLICTSSLLLHIFLIYKKALRTERYQAPSAPGASVAEVHGSVDGLVTSQGMDRIYLMSGRRQVVVLVDQGQPRPPIGGVARIFYKTTPNLPTMERFEVISPPPGH